VTLYGIGLGPGDAGESDESADEEVVVDESEFGLARSQVQYPDELYESRDAAESRADELGIEGSHEMVVEGDVYYVPGVDHSVFLDAIAENSYFDTLPAVEVVAAEDDAS